MFDNLAVVNFRTDNMSPLQQAWRRRRSILMAESCARQVWVGTRDDFSDFPESNDVDLSVGVDAYRFLLRLACGLESPKKGETNVKGEIFSRWDRRKQRAVVTRGIDSAFQKLKSDSRIVSAFYLNQLKSSKYGLVARDLSGFRKGDKAVIVSDLNEKGSVASNTDWLLRVLNNRGRRSSLVYVTNPCPTKTQRILEKALYMQSQGLVEYPVTSIGFEGLSKTIEGSDHVFCDMAMGEDCEADKKMISVWQNRAGRSNSFIHLRGAYGTNGSSTMDWVEADLEQYISPEDLFQEANGRLTANLALFQKAEQAIDVIVDMRARNENVSRSTFRSTAPSLLVA